MNVTRIMVPSGRALRRLSHRSTSAGPEPGPARPILGARPAREVVRGPAVAAAGQARSLRCQFQLPEFLLSEVMAGSLKPLPLLVNFHRPVRLPPSVLWP
ncbi:hypothetical protein P3T39_001883 [Kitasatospora sp. GP82]|nr:hypothetical protein [Kitasatospora sp. GP82]